MLVLAVKPQQMKDAVAPLAGKLGNALVISIAAGLGMDSLARWLGGHRNIVRCMPNTPALIGAGITGLCALPEVSDEGRATADRVLYTGEKPSHLAKNRFNLPPELPLSWADLEDPADVGPALRRMRQAVADKLDVPLPAPESGASAAQPIGATPQPEAIQLSLSAARPGPRAHTQLAVFARGLRVYQLSMLGPRLDEATWAQWLGSVRLN